MWCRLINLPPSHRLLFRAIDDVFAQIQSTPKREFLLYVSYLEIYNDNIKVCTITFLVAVSMGVFRSSADKAITSPTVAPE